MKYVYGIFLTISIMVIVFLYLSEMQDLMVGKLIMVICSAFAATSIMKLVSLRKNKY